MKRIVKQNEKFKVEKKTLFGWRAEQIWLGCDLTGFDYGWGDLEFSSLEEVEEYLKETGKGYKEIIRYEY